MVDNRGEVVDNLVDNVGACLLAQRVASYRLCSSLECVEKTTTSRS